MAIGYLLVFLLLDWVSFIRPFQGLNITPWNSQPALAARLHGLLELLPGKAELASPVAQFVVLMDVDARAVLATAML